MSLPQPRSPFGPDDDLASEQDSRCRNEYVDGEVFAMSGASDAHGTAARNLAASLRTARRGKPCKPVISAMKVHVEAANSFFYPDILVTCDPRDPRDPRGNRGQTTIILCPDPDIAAWIDNRGYALSIIHPPR
jgi:Uma2 family endonuclease